MANRALLFDLAVAGALLSLALVEEFVLAAPAGTFRHGDVTGALTAAAVIAPLLWRRERPILAMAAAMALYFGRLGLGYDASSAMNTVQFVALYSVGVYGRRPAATVARLAAAAVVVAAFLLQVAAGRLELVAAMISVGTWAGAGVLGETVYARRRYQAVLEERARLLESSHEERERLAIQAERARIARELHDVWAHTLSVVVVQAGAAEEVFDERPEQARQALGRIREAGLKALAEVRRLIATDMAGAPVDEADARMPAPTLAALPALVEELGRAGVPVAVTVSGPLDAIPEDVSLTAYRVVQQALTNTLSHGGAGVRSEVRLAVADGGLEIAVADDGRGVSPQEQPRRGRGLIGMRERILLFGGAFSAGPRPEGGFLVEARIPLAPAGMP